MYLFLHRLCIPSLYVYSKRCLCSLLLVEHENGKICQSTLHSLTAAHSVGGDVFCLVAGTKNQSLYVAETISKMKGVSKVLLSVNQLYKHSFPHYLSDLICLLLDKFKFSHIAISASTLGKSVIPQIGGKLNIAPISDITGVINESTFVRTIYASNAILTLISNESVKLFTVRSTAFTAAQEQTISAPIEEINLPIKQGKIKWKSGSSSSSERPDLSNAKIVVSGGRGLKSGNNFELLYKLADKIGASVGASRAAVDAGFVPNELQVGQTGKIVAPQLYIAVGISGAIQHLAGMKDSKTIVSINKDPDAPIFQVSDFGLVADLFEAIPELTDLL